MIHKNIGKLSIILIIAIKISIADTNNPKNKLFTFHNYDSKDKEILFDQAVLNNFLSKKPTGLQMTVLDLDFPETTSTTTTIYRAVQCLMNGLVDYLQRKVYKNISVKLTSKEPYNTGSDVKCPNELVLSISPPAKVNDNNIMTNHFRLFEKPVTLNKDESKVVEFKDIFNQGFVELELFWVNFAIKGKCSKYIQVELLKPNNSDEWGDIDPEKAKQEATQPEKPGEKGPEPATKQT